MSENEVQGAPVDGARERRDMLMTLVRLAIPLWRAQRRLQKDGGESSATYAALRHMERATELLGECGIQSKDYLGQAYDPGMSAFIAPVTFQQDEGCVQETIIETMSPAVFFRGQIIVKSEVVIGVPVAAPAPPPALDASEGPPKAPEASPREDSAISAAATPEMSYRDETTAAAPDQPEPPVPKAAE